MNLNQKIREAALRLIGNNNSIIEASKPKVYRALLTQSGTDAPTAVVLENTLRGELVWTYTSQGRYTGTLNGVFLQNKVITNINQTGINLSFPEETGFKSFYRSNDNTVTILCKLTNYDDSDDLLIDTSVEILVYP